MLSDKFTHKLTDSPLPQCVYCKHAGKGGKFAACAAFPGAIPREIRENRFDHRQPWIDPATGEPGDKGVALERSITFEPDDTIDPDLLAALYRVLDALHGPR